MTREPVESPSMTEADVEFDVIIASDLRFPGGTSHSIVEEVVAQSSAGYRTGLVHLHGPLVAQVQPLNPLIRRVIERDQATLLVGRSPVRAKVLVLRHPAVAQTALDELPPMDVDHVIVVANAGPVDSGGMAIYDVPEVTRKVRERLGHSPLWAPIGPQVRAEIRGQVGEGQLLADDWVNIIDVDAWSAQRSDWCADRPVIGRHSRPHRQKWPSDARVLRQVYPMDGSMLVRVLGGAEPAEELVGPLPDTWTVLPFGAMEPRQFLAGIDFFVYFHDPKWVEAFGRTILEAVASGALAILPPHFEELFGDAAVYAAPDEVGATIRGFREDRNRYEARVSSARKLVRARFGHEAHRKRLQSLIGVPPQGGSRPAPVSVPLITAGVAKPRVLLMSSNGAGMGHLTRLLAYARRLEPDADVSFLSLSLAAPLVGRFGFAFEYLPSAKALMMPPRVWEEVYVSRVSETLARIRPDVVVFDGTWPYAGTAAIREAVPGPRWVWSRRGMWRAGVNRDQLEKSDWFDAVLEPGDLAAPYDHGATRQAPAYRVGPVTLLDREDLEDRATARSALHLPQAGRLALISLGAGNINDTSSDVGAAVAALGALGVGVCMTQPEIASTPTNHADVHLVRDYPLARRYAAFDLVISASGYNSFQELLRMGVPSLFVPNRATALDDQEGRARYAADQGWAHQAETLSVEAVTPLLEDLLLNGRSKVEGALAADPGNGAEAAAAMLLGLAEGSSVQTTTVGGER